jgi:transcriptional adapter 3
LLFNTSLIVDIFQEDNDEILAEIKKCQEELRATALHTVEQLKRLIKLAEVELEKSEVRKKLKVVEQEVCTKLVFCL